MKYLYAMILSAIVTGFIYTGCTKDKTSNLKKGVWKVENYRIKEDLGFKIDTIFKNDSLIIDEFIFPEVLMDTILKRGEYIYESDYLFSNENSFYIDWMGKENLVIEVFIKNHNQPYYMSFYYVKSVGIVIKDYSHAKSYLQKVILDSDTIDISSLIKSIRRKVVFTQDSL